MAPRRFAGADAAIRSWYGFLTGSGVTRASGGKIQPLSRNSALGFIGNLGHESAGTFGDIVEHGSGAGRGALQYTGARRGPYDAARAAAVKQGIDPNSMQFQQQYFAKEYTNNDLAGWTKAFDGSPRNASLEAEAVRYRRQYLRPAAGLEHDDGRIAWAKRAAALTGGSTGAGPTGAGPTGAGPTGAGPSGSTPDLGGALQSIGSAIGQMPGMVMNQLLGQRNQQGQGAILTPADLLGPSQQAAQRQLDWILGRRRPDGSGSGG